MVPPIKIQWIKTKLVSWISSNVPNYSWRWIEPFMWSWVVWFNMKPKYALFSDTNPHTIKFYDALNRWKINSVQVKTFLQYEGEKLKENWVKHYKYIRDRFNDSHNPLDFLFLNRSCFNWMIRFNSKWWFNVPYWHKPERFSKSYVTKITNQVFNLEISMRWNKWEFVCQDFSKSIESATNWDFIYCDPPYLGRHVDYFDSWSEENETQLNNLLENTWVKCMLSTWHSNKYRKNEYIEKIWWNFHIWTREHFYYFWWKESNRNSILEAILTNYPTKSNNRDTRIIINIQALPLSLFDGKLLAKG